MTQDEFLKRFLPNHDKRLEEMFSGLKSMEMKILAHAAFISINFEEAFENFVNKLCEAQRKECANYAKCKHFNDVFSSRSTSILSIMDAILNAEQPKIEDL